MRDHQNALAARLREAREAAGLTQQQVADWLGVRRPGVVEIERGKRAVKSDELAKLATLYGRSLAWFTSGEYAPEDLIAAALFRAGDGADPVLRRETGALARRCHLLTETELRLGLPKRASHPPQYAAEDVVTDRTNALEHGRRVAYQERNRLGLGLTSPLRDPWGIVESAGLHVLSLRLGAQHPIDGVFARLQAGGACVGVNVDKWVFRQIFTVVHEYGHALLDTAVQSELCDTNKAWRPSERQLYSNRELRANQFAAVFLVPREALLWYLESSGKLRQSRSEGSYATGLTTIEIVRAQDHFGVSCDMLLWRLQNEDLVNAAERRRLRDDLQKHGGVLRLARTLGYDWQAHAQPFTRAHELALLGYRKGHLGLGELADIFSVDKSEMYERLRDWNFFQEFSDEDALIGQPG